MDTTTKKSGFPIFTVGIFLIIFLGIGMVVSQAGKKAVEEQKAISLTPTVTPGIDMSTEKHGSYLGYSYDYAKQNNSDVYYVTFSPFLPKKDAVIISMSLNLIGDIFGTHLLSDIQPELVPRGENNTLVMRYKGSQDIDYFVNITKEDTGEVNSMTIWIEKKN